MDNNTAGPRAGAGRWRTALCRVLAAALLAAAHPAWAGPAEAGAADPQPGTPRAHARAHPATRMPAVGDAGLAVFGLLTAAIGIFGPQRLTDKRWVLSKQ